MQFSASRLEGTVRMRPSGIQSNIFYEPKPGVISGNILTHWLSAQSKWRKSLRDSLKNLSRGGTIKYWTSEPQIFSRSDTDLSFAVKKLTDPTWIFLLLQKMDSSLQMLWSQTRIRDQTSSQPYQFPALEESCFSHRRWNGSLALCHNSRPYLRKSTSYRISFRSELGVWFAQSQLNQIRS